MKVRYIIIIVVFFIFATVYVLWIDGTLDPNKTRINDSVYLVRENSSYSIYLDKKKSQKLIASKIDSVIISYKYGTLFHGFNNSKNKFEWIYINVSKNVSYGFGNVLEATSSTMGENYVDSIITADQTWRKYN